jgi:hypothetical protein
MASRQAVLGMEQASFYYGTSVSSAACRFSSTTPARRWSARTAQIDDAEGFFDAG